MFCAHTHHILFITDHLEAHHRGKIHQGCLLYTQLISRIQMKTIIAIDETSFYHPKLMEDILRLDEIEIVGVLLITKIPKVHSLLEKVKHNLMSFKICEVVVFVNIFSIIINELKPYLRRITLLISK